jgi:hypothetical protein
MKLPSSIALIPEGLNNPYADPDQDNHVARRRPAADLVAQFYCIKAWLCDEQLLCWHQSDLHD